jgi:AraC-like DNA-binding protein
MVMRNKKPGADRNRYYPIPLERLSVNLSTANWGNAVTWNYDNIAAPFWRIYWNSRKGWNVFLHSTAYSLNPGRLTVIPPNTPCRAQSRGRAKHFYIHFIMEPCAFPYKPGVYGLPLSTENRAILSDLMKTEAGQPGDNFFHTIKVKRLCYDVLTRLPVKSWMRPPYSDKIAAAITFMSENITTPLPNRELAGQIGMNTNAFLRLFQLETHQSPQKWYLQRRIQKALLLLSSGNDSIESIAEKTGFCDRGHFSKVFARVVKLGPSAYRKKLRKAP